MINMNTCPDQIIPLLLALVSGVLMAVQGSVNAALSKIIGLLEAAFVVHITGAALLSVLLFLLKFGSGSLSKISEAPWYSWLGGAAGVAIVYLVAAAIPAVGVANATTGIIVGQVVTAVLIDHFGVFGVEKIPFGINQLAGFLLLAFGARLLLK